MPQVLGGLFGAGLGESKQKFLYIPEPHNDFIFSVLAEELGFAGCLLVFILFAIFIFVANVPNFMKFYKLKNSSHSDE